MGVKGKEGILDMGTWDRQGKWEQTLCVVFPILEQDKALDLRREEGRTDFLGKLCESLHVATEESKDEGESRHQTCGCLPISRVQEPLAITGWEGPGANMCYGGTVVFL